MCDKEIKDLINSAKEIQKIAVNKFNFPKNSSFLSDGRGFHTFLIFDYCHKNGLPILTIDGKNGNDAIDPNGNTYELKSTHINSKSNGFSTSANLSLSIINRFRNVDYWLFALVDDFDLFWVKLLTKQQMSPIIEEMEKKHSINPKYTKKININKIKTSGVKISDFDYTTNNPKIPFNFVEANGKTIHSNSGDLSLFFE